MLQFNEASNCVKLQFKNLDRERFYEMDINYTERNPIYPNAIRLCDVHSGVAYRLINTRCGKLGRGVFCSEPYQNNEGSRIVFMAKVVKNNPLTKNPYDTTSELLLNDSGIAKYYNDIDIIFWNDQNFCIPDTAEGLAEYQNWLENGGNDILVRYTNALMLKAEDDEDDEGYETDEDLRYLCR